MRLIPKGNAPNPIVAMEVNCSGAKVESDVHLLRRAAARDAARGKVLRVMRFHS